MCLQYFIPLYVVFSMLLVNLLYQCILTNSKLLIFLKRRFEFILFRCIHTLYLVYMLIGYFFILYLF